jgi:hypothetical protein
VAAALLLAVTATAARATAAQVTIPIADLGYRDGVTAVGTAPSVTFDLPHYATLRAATLVLVAQASAAAGPASTIAVAVNGRPVFRETLRRIGSDPKLVVPLPLPPASAQPLAVTVSGELRAAGDPCAADPDHRLFLRIGRDSRLVIRTLDGGSAEAFFRDYRGAIDVVGPANDPGLAAVPDQLDRLEPWHRVDARLVPRALPGRRALVLTRSGPTVRRGDVLQMSLADFAALPVPRGQAPAHSNGSIAFADLRQHLGTATGVGELAFDVPLDASIVGGVPDRLRVHVIVAHSALPAGTSGTLQALVNGVLVGARVLSPGAGTQAIDAGVPASVVGPSNDLRVVVAPDVPHAACVAGTGTVTASLLGTSTFSWGGVEPRPPTIESFLTALHGRVVLLVAPSFTAAAFHFVNEVGKMNAAIARLDVVPFAGRIPAGYDAAIVFAPPQALGGLGLPIRPRASAFAVIDPAADADVLDADGTSTFGLLQLGSAGATPLLAVSYHGAPRAVEQIATVDAAQLAVQIAGVSVIDARGATTYDIGAKLRVAYPGDDTVEQVWERFRIAIAAALVLLIVAAALHAARRLAGRTI